MVTTPKNTNPLVPTPSNPSSLKPRYAIRPLLPEHASWVTAIVLHSDLFHSPAWPKIYPKNKTSRCHYGVKEATYLFDHQIASGLSYGVFDTEYVFKNPESAATRGKLYWDASEPSIEETHGLEAESKRLLDQMDFPLVSVALSYDGINALVPAKMATLLEVLPLFGLLYHVLELNDPRDPKTWKPTQRGQVLMRNATSTRREYEGEKIMGGLARWLMRQADLMGYGGIQIETVHDAVSHVWSEAEEPYKGRVVSELDMGRYRDDGGDWVFRPATQVCKKIWVDLGKGGEGVVNGMGVNG